VTNGKAVGKGIVATLEEGEDGAQEKEVEEDTKDKEDEKDEWKEEKDTESNKEDVVWHDKGSNKEKKRSRCDAITRDGVYGLEIEKIRERGHEFRTVMDSNPASKARQSDQAVDVHAPRLLCDFVGIIDAKVHVVDVVDLVRCDRALHGAQIVSRQSALAKVSPLDRKDAVLCHEQHKAEGNQEYDGATEDTGDRKDRRGEEEAEIVCRVRVGRVEREDEGADKSDERDDGEGDDERDEDAEDVPYLGLVFELAREKEDAVSVVETPFEVLSRKVCWIK